jgi:hypothetical protein
MYRGGCVIPLKDSLAAHGLTARLGPVHRPGVPQGFILLILSALLEQRETLTKQSNILTAVSDKEMR